MKKTLFLMMMLGLVTTACQQDNDSQNDSSNDRTVSFHPSLGAMTRATETAFEQGDEISVYAVEGNGVLKAADNRREASFAVRPGEKIRSFGDREEKKEQKREKRQERRTARKKRGAEP